jgi:lipoxygenase homology domain-containing protein 1
VYPRRHLSYIEVEDLTQPSTAKTTFVHDGWLENLALVTLSPLTPERNVYKVSVKTNDYEGAGTNGDITLSLYGKTGVASDPLLLRADRECFARGQTDTFLLDLGPLFLGDVSAIDLGFAVPRPGLAWCPHSVRVKHMNSDRAFRFDCGQWLAAESNPRTGKVINNKRKYNETAAAAGPPSAQADLVHRGP